jgi:hypothetical protein
MQALQFSLAQRCREYIGPPALRITALAIAQATICTVYSSDIKTRRANDKYALKTETCSQAPSLAVASGGI